MQTDLTSVSKLFTENIFRIPDYQRGYAWTEKQLKEFWLDLEQLSLGKQHYTGVLTLEKVTEKVWKSWDDDTWIIQAKSYCPYYVVDGQQRLTTIVILIQVICEAIKATQRLNYTSKDDILSKYVFLQKDSAISGSYLFGYEKDDPSYEYLKTKILSRASDKHSSKEETIYTKNLTHAKEFFTAKIKELSLTELEILFSKVTQHLLFNVFVISKDIDTNVAFETMNNRGILLSNLELLKNRLIYLTAKFEIDNEEKHKLRKTVNESWKTVYHYLGKNPRKALNDNFFLALHFFIYFGPELYKKNPDAFKYGAGMIFHRGEYKERLLETYFVPSRIGPNVEENKLLPQEIYNYALHLKKTVETYYDLMFPENSSFSDTEKTWIERNRRIAVSREFQPIIVLLLTIYMMRTASATRQKLLTTVEKYLFVTSLVPYKYRREDRDIDFATEAIHLSQKKHTVDDLLKKIDSCTTKIINEPDFQSIIVEGMTRAGYYGWHGLKYCLFEYEQELKRKARAKRDKLTWEDFWSEDYENDFATIEHILPRTVTDPYWKNQFSKFDVKQKNILKNSLGNLVPISKSKNSSLQNSSFEVKKGDENNQAGYRYGSYSEIEVASYSDWGAEQILERGLRILKFIEERWDLDLGNEESKIRLLGLKFLRPTSGTTPPKMVKRISRKK